MGGPETSHGASGGFGPALVMAWWIRVWLRGLLRFGIVFVGGLRIRGQSFRRMQSISSTLQCLCGGFILELWLFSGRFP